MHYSHPAIARLIWPITQQGKDIAQRFAKEHHAAIAERVRQNTLAVWVVHEFLAAVGIDTDLSTSDSWNPVLQLTEDVADLVVTGLGRLECRLVAEDNRWHIPAGAERIGYVAIALDEVGGEASLLGYLPGTPSDSLSLDQLSAMDDFPAHLHHIRQSIAAEPSIRLSQWLEGTFDRGWQAVDELLAAYLWTPAFRQGGPARPQETALKIKRAKPLDLGSAQVALVLEVEQESEFATIGVRLYPLGEPAYLPTGLTVKILDQADTVCLAAQARSVDNYLQLYFRGHPEEPFTAQVALGDAEVVEHFII